MNANASAKSAKVISARSAPSDSFQLIPQTYPPRPALFMLKRTDRESITTAAARSDTQLLCGRANESPLSTQLRDVTHRSGVDQGGLGCARSRLGVAPAPHVGEVGDGHYDDHIANTEDVGEGPTMRNRKHVSEPRKPGVVHDVGVLEVPDERRETCGVPGPLGRRHC